ncbi:MAG: hypothetical protein ACO1TE_02465 [Prosthecobacter sp.]
MHIITASRLIPPWIKLAYTAFLAVLVPVYWLNYGPTNFLYFCDVALLLTLAGVWLEKPLLISLPAVGILLPQMLWCVDFFARILGMKLTGMTEYMFNEANPLFLRGLSLFHGWLPFLVLWLVFRLGYDRRAFKGWAVLSALLCLVAYFLLPAAGAELPNPNLPRNVNYVFGMDDAKPQQWMSAPLYLVTWIALLTIIVYLPTHLLLKKLCPAPEQAAAKRA